MDNAMGVPPGRVTLTAVRRRLVRRRIREAAGVLAVAVVAVAGVTGAVRVYSGGGPGPAAHHRPSAPTIYAAYDSGGGVGVPATKEGGGKRSTVTAAAVIPISTATNTAGKPIRFGRGVLGQWFIAITPDGRTVYVANTGRHTVVPISTATNKAGKPITVAPDPAGIAITPDSKTAYAVSEPTHGLSGTVTPIDTATNTAGKPIAVGGPSFEIAITPDGKTVYAYSGNALTPISTATNTAGKTIQLHRNFGEGAIAITPDSKTVYLLTIRPNTVIPVSTATNTPGTPIKVRLEPGDVPMFGAIAATQFVITPDGKTVYLLTGADTVIPISTATNTAGQPIQFGADCRSQPREYLNIGIAITRDGKTAYLACDGAVVPISTATNTPGKPIPVPLPFKNPDAIAITP